jgi:hypothetical protein
MKNQSTTSLPAHHFNKSHPRPKHLIPSPTLIRFINNKNVSFFLPVNHSHPSSPIQHVTATFQTSHHHLPFTFTSCPPLQKPIPLSPLFIHKSCTYHQFHISIWAPNQIKGRDDFKRDGWLGFKNNKHMEKRRRPNPRLISINRMML